jgi:hypothetical protein
MLWRSTHNPTAYDDDWEDQPTQGLFFQWVLGVLLPLVLITYGVYAIVVRDVTFGGRITMNVRGFNAIAFGAAWVSAGTFVHCHYFWGNVYNQAWFAVLGKILGAAGFIVGMAVLLVRNGVLGIG